MLARTRRLYFCNTAPARLGYPGKTRILSEMTSLHTGHFSLRFAQGRQHTRWRHGMNSALILASKHTLHSQDGGVELASAAAGPRCLLAAGVVPGAAGMAPGAVGGGATSPLSSRSSTYFWNSAITLLGLVSWQAQTAYSFCFC